MSVSVATGTRIQKTEARPLVTRMFAGAQSPDCGREDFCISPEERTGACKLVYLIAIGSVKLPIRVFIVQTLLRPNRRALVQTPESLVRAGGRGEQRPRDEHLRAGRRTPSARPR